MTDPFATVGIPRRPCPDLEAAAERHRERALALHPDTPGGDAARFAELEEAWSLLRDTPRRLRVWLALEGFAGPPAGIPSDPGIQRLFGEIAASLAAARDLDRRRAAASGAIARALLTPETAALVRRCEDLASEVDTIRERLTAALAGFDAQWNAGDRTAGPAIAGLLPATTLAEKWAADLRRTLARLRGLA